MQIDNAEDIDLVMPMYNLLEYSNNCSKKLGSSWQYYRNGPFTNYASVFNDFNNDEDGNLFNFE